MAALLKPNGVVTLEFPHLLQLIQHSQFDTIYHEHYSYLSLYSVNSIFKAAGLRVFDVEELKTHGGSLRIYGCRRNSIHKETSSVQAIFAQEIQAGMKNKKIYSSFQKKAEKVKDSFISFLLKAKAEGKTVAGYGAAAKGNTLMNYAGIRPDLIPFICDAAKSKIGQYMPASHIPILAPSALDENTPDYLVILPWNIVGEIMKQNAHLVEKGTKFVIAVPELKII